MSWKSRVLARRGLRRGHQSRDFTITELADAVHADHNENVYIDVDVSDQLAVRGSMARAAISARLAPAPPLATALLCLEQTSFTILLSPTILPLYDPRLRLRLEADIAPLQELLIWFDERMLAQIDMPFLTLRNITGKKNYWCHECGAEFEHPNSLKVHLFMSCRVYTADGFWSEVARRLGAGGQTRRGHVCVYCGKLYSRKYGLKIHIRTHTGYKPLRCRHCARAFGDPSNLNKHVRLHTGEREGSHACSLCGKRLARRRDLQRHLRAHHADQGVDIKTENV